MNYSLETVSGLRLDFTNPHPDSIDINDIGQALSNLCRFGGQVPEFYSVAEHSIHCWELAENLNLSPKVQRTVLLHDASEAYCIDVPRTLKKLLQGYQEIENNIQKVIGNKYDTEFPFSEIVHQIDNTLLKQEAEWFGFNCTDWNFGPILPCGRNFISEAPIKDHAYWAREYVSIYQSLIK